METRCKSLEQNLCDMLEANLQCQTEEVRLRETTVNMLDESEYTKITNKLKDVQNSLVSYINKYFIKSNYFFIINNVILEKL